MKDIIEFELKEHLAVMSDSAMPFKELELVVEACCRCLEGGGKLMFCGNGGSAADAQHLAAEFVVRYRQNREPLAAVALSTDASALTAAGNDFGFEVVFERQVQSLGREGDLLFLISTSGNSENVLRALVAAKARGVMTVAITGANPSSLSGGADLSIMIPSRNTARIQEAYMFLGHLLCGVVEERMKGAEGA